MLTSRLGLSIEQLKIYRPSLHYLTHSYDTGGGFASRAAQAIVLETGMKWSPFSQGLTQCVSRDKELLVSCCYHSIGSQIPIDTTRTQDEIQSSDGRLWRLVVDSNLADDGVRRD